MPRREPHPAATSMLKSGSLALLLTLPLPLMSDYSGLDVWLENHYFDSSRGIFPWRELHWFEALSHGGPRSVLFFLVGLNVVTLLLAWLSPATLQQILPPFWRRPRVLGYLLAASLAGPLMVGLLKKTTTHPCPWNLDLYGGQAAFHHLLDPPLFTLSDAGRCFPGGHASGGFALLALVPLLQGKRQLQALLLALGAGFFMGWSRMMQGAHFLSHNLWSAWICWAMVLACYGLIKPWREEGAVLMPSIPVGEEPVMQARTPGTDY